MSQLPAGTVTFLFADVEGSTRLLRELGERWADALADYRAMLRETFSARGGSEVDTQGDGMFFVFPRARDAVAAAAEAQRRIEEHSWPAAAPLRVRMGLHTGEPAVGDEGYVGLDVVRAARIAAAAHGGQVLLSATTQALVPVGSVEGVSTTFLGEFELKDLPAPEPIHQLVVAGLRERFPAPRIERGSAAEAVPIAGRESELARELQNVARDLGASIQREVLESIKRDVRQPKRAFAWPLVVLAAVVLVVVVPPVVWLLTN